jgi:cobalt/nickel transport system permease protein
MFYEPFATGNSLIHRLDPRIKLISATLFSFIIALSHQIHTLLAGVALAILLLGLACLNMREVLKRLMVVWGFLLLLWVVLPVTYGGESLFQLGILRFSRQGIDLALQITIKSNAILLLLMTLVTTMGFVRLGYALSFFRVPSKLVYLLLFTYRYVFVIEQEYQRLTRAARIRSFRPRTNLHTYRTYAYLIGMLFVRASVRAERIYQAMRCRGFKGQFYCLQDFTIGPIDWVWVGLTGLFSIVLLLIEWHVPWPS